MSSNTTDIELKIGLSDSDKATMQAAVVALIKASLITPYSTSATYAVGDFVYYDGKFYKCTTAISTAEAWTSGHWAEATLNDIIDAVNAAVASVNNKVDPDDICPNLRAGFSFLADNFNTKLVYNDNLAYNYRTTAGGEEVANQIKQKAIIGGSLGWNQLMYGLASRETVQGITRTASSDGTEMTFTGTCAVTDSYTIANVGCVLGHKYLLTLGNISLPSGARIGFSSNDKSTSTIISGPTNTVFQIYVAIQQGVEVNFTTKPQVFDLTACFGPTIADYIYNLEQATAGAGVAWFRRYFNKPYYPYHAIGGFTHVQTKGKKYARFNQWDEETELGYIDGNGTAVSSSSRLRSKFIRVLPNTTYYFKSSEGFDCLCFYDENQNKTGSVKYSANTTYTTPVDAAYVRFSWGTSYGTTYKHDTCINLRWDGERDGEYEPYDENTYDVDPIELMGIPKIDAQGNLYFDGDRYNSDGTVEEEHGIATIDGTNITAGFKGTASNGNNFYLLNISNAKLPANNQTAPEVTCPNYGVYSLDVVRYGETVVQGFTANTGDGLWLAMGSSSDFDTAAKVNAWLANNPITIIYKLATPTTSEANSYPELQIGDNWGTEDFLPPDGDTRPVEVPVGNDTDYLPDLKAKTESQPSNPATDGDYVTHRESGVNSYTPLATWLLNNGYPVVQDLSSGITSSAGLTFQFKKACKIGNIVMLSIRALNETGSDIAADTPLIDLASGLYNTSAIVRLCGYVGTTQTGFDISSSDGKVMCFASVPSNGYIHLYASYAIA